MFRKTCMHVSAACVRYLCGCCSAVVVVDLAYITAARHDEISQRSTGRNQSLYSPGQRRSPTPIKMFRDARTRSPEGRNPVEAGGKGPGQPQ